MTSRSKPSTASSYVKQLDDSDHPPLAISGRTTDDAQIYLRPKIRLDSPDDDDIDYVTLHNILYYLYTGYVNLVPRFIRNISHPEGFPEEANASSLYRNADRFMLWALRERCYKYLKATTDASNVAERLFHKDCEYYLRLRELFLKYLVANFEEVKETEGWLKFAQTVSPTMSQTLRLLREDGWELSPD